MIATFRDFVIATLLPALLVMLLSADPARAQTGMCTRTASGQTSARQQQLSQVQTALQQQLTQLQTVLDQLQSGQITLPANSRITTAQLETVLQQRITQLQQVQNRLANSAQQTSQQTTSTVSPRATLVRGRR
jgi:hypothetical protein